MHWPFSLLSTQPGPEHAAPRLRRRRRRRNRWRAPYSLVAALFAALAAHATSVTPPSFPELVSESDLIARGTVTAVSSRWVDAAGSRVIKTLSRGPRVGVIPTKPRTARDPAGATGICVRRVRRAGAISALNCQP